MTGKVDIWTAQDRQRALIACPVFELFFGGARGGGKTDGVLGDFLEHAATYGKHATGLMVRRKRVELVETIERSRQIYGPLGWKYSEQKSMWTARNGARLRFGYLERDADADNYHGHSYTRLYVEEITNFPSDKPILKLMATLRSAHGVPVGFRATGNPGGPGHHWVRRRYVDPAPQGGKIITDEKSGLQRVFIQSKVADNKYLGVDYIQRIKASGGEALERAWLHGDWSVIEGAFFSEWTSDCIIAPFTIPSHWTRLRTMDFGYAVPSAIYWLAVVGDTTHHDGRELPRGALIAHREWYTSNGQPNVGLRLTAEEIARSIVLREAGETITRGVLDPSAFAADGGPSIAERMNRILLAADHTPFIPADNRRTPQAGHLGGWDQMRQRLKAKQLFFFSTCTEAIRTIPVLQHDHDKPEDLDTGSEDHAADAVRYGCMARPYTGMTSDEHHAATEAEQRRQMHRLKPGEPVTYIAEPGGGLRCNATMWDIIARKQRERKLREY